jgi:GGDEF domain-containing protein
MAALGAPIRVEDAAGSGPGTGAREARVGVSVGIAFAEPDLDADVLLRHADAAMYQAKAAGKGRRAVFDPTLGAAAAEQSAREADLAQAL